MKQLGYRALPTVNEDLGSMALEGEPVMEQLFIQSPDDLSDPEAFERKLFVWRKHSTHIIRDAVPRAEDFYIATSSYKTIVYKGQLLTEQVGPYFPDLQHKRVVSALAVVTSRLSTNTFPSWKLAQQFRYIAHNGEERKRDVRGKGVSVRVDLGGGGIVKKKKRQKQKRQRSKQKKK